VSISHHPPGGRSTSSSSRDATAAASARGPLQHEQLSKLGRSMPPADAHAVQLRGSKAGTIDDSFFMRIACCDNSSHMDEMCTAGAALLHRPDHAPHPELAQRKCYFVMASVSTDFVTNSSLIVTSSVLIGHLHGSLQQPLGFSLRRQCYVGCRMPLDRGCSPHAGQE
jgi:hypothetical protein